MKLIRAIATTLALAALALLAPGPSDAAIAFVAGSSGSPGNVSSFSATLPTGYNTAGDMTIVIATNGSGTITTPAGWTVVFSGPGTAVVYRFFQSGDPSSITFSTGSANYSSTSAATYSGVDSTTPIDKSNGTQLYAVVSGSGSYTTIQKAPSVNPAYSNDQLVLLFADPYISAATMSPPSGFTSRASAHGGGTSSMVCDESISTGANTGEQQIAAANAGSNYRTGVTVALKASGSSGATAAAPTATLAGMHITASSGASAALSLINVANGDLVAVFVTLASNQTITPPSGYTAAQTVTGYSGGNAGLYTHTWLTGDTTTPSFTFGATASYIAHTLVLQSIGSTKSPVLDASGKATGTGSVSVSALTPTGTNVDYAWFDAWSGASTGTNSSIGPGTLTVDENYLPGPNSVTAWQSQVNSSLGAFTATMASGGSTAQAGIAALFAAPSAASAQPVLIIN